MKKNILVLLLLFNSPHSFSQKVSIANERMNIFYIGLDNPVSIAADGFATKSLIIKTKNGKLTKYDDGYIFHPDSIGKSEIILYSKLNGKLKEIGRSAFRSKNLPLPVFHIGSIEKIKPKSEIASQEYVRAQLENTDINIKYEIDSFKVCIFSNDTCKYSITENFGNKLNEEIRTKFQELHNLDVVVFKDIYIKQFDGSSAVIEPLIITVKN